MNRNIPTFYIHEIKVFFKGKKRSQSTQCSLILETFEIFGILKRKNRAGQFLQISFNIRANCLPNMRKM